MRLLALFLAIIGNLAAADTKARPSGDSPALRLERRIPLPGVDGRLGRLAVDVEGQRLFVAAPVSGRVEVVDLRAGRRLYTIGGVNRPQGLFYHAATKRLFVSSRGEASVLVYDAGYRLQSRVPFPGGDPEVIRFVPVNQLLVGYGTGAIGMLDLQGRKLGDIRLDSHPEEFIAEPGGTRVWVSLPLSKNVVLVDRGARAILRTWAVSTATSTGTNRSIALDQKNRRLFVGTWRPARLLVLDSNSGMRIDDRGTVNDPESISYDAANRRLYITGTDSFVDVVRQISPDKYEPLARIPTAPNARTSLLIPELKRLCVAVPKSQGREAEILVFEVLP